MERVEWVTAQVRWRKGSGGGVKGSGGGVVEEYLEGRRMVMGCGLGGKAAVVGVVMVRCLAVVCFVGSEDDVVGSKSACKKLSYNQVYVKVRILRVE
jgi:hypothetical protein